MEQKYYKPKTITLIYYNREGQTASMRSSDIYRLIPVIKLLTLCLGNVYKDCVTLDQVKQRCLHSSINIIRSISLTASPIIQLITVSSTYAFVIVGSCTLLWRNNLTYCAFKIKQLCIKHEKQCRCLISSE